MQILEDNIEDYGDLAKRIAALREQVAVLMEQKQKVVEQEPKVITKEVIVESPVNNKLVKENELLKKQIEEKEPAENLSANDDLVQEVAFLKKQLSSKEKTIKELGFKLEMLKMAKNLRSGAMVNEKSEDLKKIINEYIKELDKNIASLNIK